MIEINNFINTFSMLFPELKNLQPWEVTGNLPAILAKHIFSLNDSYDILNGIAIHKSAVLEEGVKLKAPVIISENSFVGSHSCLRGGVYLGKSSVIGNSCEVKASMVFCNSAVAHFNFIGDSLIGDNVNFEAGSVTANHYNERENKLISIYYNSKVITIGAEKFGALVGDNSKIGANAVLSPGTILFPGSIVKRLELIDQLENL
jgi:NDP-sugar pyrophosphorylase family protein